MPLQIVRNDITRMHVDAIVNAANSSLLGGGGVDGAIHRAAGPKLLEECRTLHGCRTGEAKITGGYLLPCRYVIHTVGPVYRGGKEGEAELLASCYRNSLHLALRYKCESVAFPLISAGAYGYPGEEALRIATDSVRQFLAECDMTVYLVVFDRAAFRLSRSLTDDVQAFIDDVYEDSHTDLNRRGPMRKLRPLVLASEEACVYGAALPQAGMERFANDVEKDLDSWMGLVEDGFSAALLRRIDDRHMTDAQCYKKANVDRRLFNKIKNNPDYKPGKAVVLSFALALELDVEETRKLLSTAGFALSRSSKTDVVVEYFIRHRIFDVIRINEVLFGMDLPLLSC